MHPLLLGKLEFTKYFNLNFQQHFMYLSLYVLHTFGLMMTDLKMAEKGTFIKHLKT
jgi:hypothetical protein